MKKDQITVELATGIYLHVELNTPPMTSKEFREKKERNSIALDGFVKGPPWYDATGPWANYNHHEGVDRLATDCTAAQILMAIQSGMLEAFRDENGNILIHIYVNDCDQDVCLACFFLKHHYMALQVINSNLNRLVGMENKLDKTFGTYPFPEGLKGLEELLWIFNPYDVFKTAGGLERRDAQEYLNVITNVMGRVMDSLNNKGGSLPADNGFNQIGSGDGYVVIEEIGANCRMGIFGGKTIAFVSVRKRPDGNMICTIARKSEYVPFPIPAILERLNQEEISVRAQKGVENHQNDLWGGNERMVIGSPRISGTRISLEKIQEIINEEIRKNKEEIVQRRKQG